MNNKGSSMVEIIVGFLLLIILFASFLKIIDLSADMTKYSIDLDEKNNKFEELYYGLTEESDIWRADKNVNISIKICEWTKSTDGYYEEWHINNDDPENPFFDNYVTATSENCMVLSNIAIKRLENVKMKSGAANLAVFKYVYNKTDD